MDGDVIFARGDGNEWADDTLHPRCSVIYTHHAPATETMVTYCMGNKEVGGVCVCVFVRKREREKESSERLGGSNTNDLIGNTYSIRTQTKYEAILQPQSQVNRTICAVSKGQLDTLRIISHTSSAYTQTSKTLHHTTFNQ